MLVEFYYTSTVYEISEAFEDKITFFDLYMRSMNIISSQNIKVIIFRADCCGFDILDRSLPPGIHSSGIWSDVMEPCLMHVLMY